MSHMTTQNRITYLIGAGASAEALPLARDVLTNSKEIEIQGLSTSLRYLGALAQMAIEKSESKDKNDFLKALITKFNWLADKGLEYGSVDTYAKYCSLIRGDSRKDISQYVTFGQ